MKSITAALSGILFGSGLSLAQMTNPAKVLAFLDFFGAWDPSLAFVMGSALAVSALGYRLARARGESALGEPFSFTTSSQIDARLLVGAGFFGLGWGLAGLCPGPALASLVTGSVPVAIFVAAMVAGMILSQGISRRRSESRIATSTEAAVPTPGPSPSIPKPAT